MDSSNEDFDEEDDENEQIDSSEKGERTDDNNIVSSEWDSHHNVTKQIKANEEKINKETKELKETTIQSNSDDKKKFITKSPDKRFGKFNEEIGFGSCKRVFRGFDFNEGREISWNTINVNGMNKEDLGRISREIVIMKKLNHPSILNYISGWFDDQKMEMVIITEMISGGSLKKHLHKIINPRLRLIKNWVKDILRGLKYLHTAVPPIVHRDIKCDNIFIDTTTGMIKIGDLGLSKIQNSNYANSYAGTEEFMAPEVFKGKYTVLADIYSLGMTILEMVTLEKPYKECESNILKIYESSKNGIMPKSLERIKNEDLKLLISKCLKSESERPSAVELLELPFLNDIESEENNRAVELRQDKIETNKGEVNKPTVTIPQFNMMNEDSELQTKNITNKVMTKSTQNVLNSGTVNRLKQTKSLTNLIKEERTETNNEKIQINSQHSINKNDLDMTSKQPSDSIKLAYTIPNQSTKKTNSSAGFESFSTDCFTKKSSNNLSVYNNTAKQINTTKTLKVSLKNSLNHQNLSFSQFEINILENSDTKQITNDNLCLNNTNIPPSFDPSGFRKEIQIVFVVHKGEWPKGKKIKFNYHLDNDTIDGVVLELQKAINLSEEEEKIVLVKLSDFISKFQNSKNEIKNDQKYSLEGGGSTTPEVDTFTKKRENLENFFLSYDKLINKISKLVNNDNTKMLIGIKSNYESLFINKKNVVLENTLKEYSEKLERLTEFLKLNDELRNNFKK